MQSRGFGLGHGRAPWTEPTVHAEGLAFSASRGKGLRLKLLGGGSIAKDERSIYYGTPSLVETTSSLDFVFGCRLLRPSTFDMSAFVASDFGSGTLLRWKKKRKRKRLRRVPSPRALSAIRGRRVNTPPISAGECTSVGVRSTTESEFASANQNVQVWESAQKRRVNSHVRIRPLHRHSIQAGRCKPNNMPLGPGKIVCFAQVYVILPSFSLCSFHQCCLYFGLVTPPLLMRVAFQIVSSPLTSSYVLCPCNLGLRLQRSKNCIFSSMTPSSLQWLMKG